MMPMCSDVAGVSEPVSFRAPQLRGGRGYLLRLNAFQDDCPGADEGIDVYRPDPSAGGVRAHSTADGRVVWEFDTVRDFKTVNGVAAKGGSMGAAGPVVVGGTLFVPSGYLGVKNGLPGNVLLAFSVQ